MGLKDLFSRNKKSNKLNGEQLGIVFDCDMFEKSDYGGEAFKIFYKNLNPYKMGTFFQIYDGDTINSFKQYYCIRIDADVNVLEYVEETFKKASDKGLAPLELRFLYADDLKDEPLVYSAYVSYGTVHTTIGGPPHRGIHEYIHKWALYEEKDPYVLIQGKNMFDIDFKKMEDFYNMQK